MTLGAALALGAFAALVAAGLLAGAITVSGPVDRPRDRGSHRAPTPTSGGLAVAAGALLGTAACAWSAPLPGLNAVAPLALIAALLGALAAADDLYDLGARP